jgi:hypothetical protein
VAQPQFRRGSWGCELTDRREKVVARVLAAATDFGAEPAVLVVGGVPVTLLGAGEAGDATGFDYRPDKAQIRCSLAGHDAAGRVADFSAVEAETNAAHHLPHVVLSEIGVGTTRTARGTIEALVDAAQHGFAIEASRLWMQLKDFVKGHVSPYRSRTRPTLPNYPAVSSSARPAQPTPVIPRTSRPVGLRGAKTLFTPWDHQDLQAKPGCLRGGVRYVLGERRAAVVRDASLVDGTVRHSLVGCIRESHCGAVRVERHEAAPQAEGGGEGTPAQGLRAPESLPGVDSSGAAHSDRQGRSRHLLLSGRLG